MDTLDYRGNFLRVVFTSSSPRLESMNQIDSLHARDIRHHIVRDSRNQGGLTNLTGCEDNTLSMVVGSRIFRDIFEKSTGDQLLSSIENWVNQLTGVFVLQLATVIEKISKTL